MIVRPIKTEKITAGKFSIEELLDKYLPDISERSVVTVTSKIVALCENRVVSKADAEKEDLIIKESDFYLASKVGSYGYNFTFTKNTLVPASGIDESNAGGDVYVLWPQDPQRSANQIRSYIKDRKGLKDVGVIITDSGCMPSRFGTIAMPIAHSGFSAVNNYVGQPDIFGRVLKVSRSSVAGGLAAAAGIEMGEGTEQTPIVIIEDVELNFQDREPTQEELDDFYTPPFKDNLFSPFINDLDWHEGGHGKN